MNNQIIFRDDLKRLKALLDTAHLFAKNRSMKDILYHPVPIADRIASMEGDVNYADLIEVINSYVEYELEQAEKAINDGQKQP